MSTTLSKHITTSTIIFSSVYPRSLHLTIASLISRLVKTPPSTNTELFSLTGVKKKGIEPDDIKESTIISGDVSSSKIINSPVFKSTD